MTADTLLGFLPNLQFLTRTASLLFYELNPSDYFNMDCKVLLWVTSLLDTKIARVIERKLTVFDNNSASRNIVCLQYGDP